MRTGEVNISAFAVVVFVASCTVAPSHERCDKERRCQDESTASPSMNAPAEPPPGVVSLTARPSTFVLHRNDTREVKLTVNNRTSEPIAVSPLVVSGMSAGTVTFPSSRCASTLAAGESCEVTGHLVATATGQSNFQIAMGAALAALSMTVMPACPANCGRNRSTNCCASSVVPGNAVGATRAGEPFFRSFDGAPDMMHPLRNAPATVSDYRLDTYEVTVGRFRAFMNAGMGTSAAPPAEGAGRHLNNPDDMGWDPAWNARLVPDTAALIVALKRCGTLTWTDRPGANENLPMNCITWYEAMAFCIWDGGYLPSELEWNYAASGGSEHRAYPWSSPSDSTIIDCSYANYWWDMPDTCVHGTPASMNRVGSESPKGDGRWGHSDLAGNAYEWNLDWSNPFYLMDCEDCAQLTQTGSRRVMRGGASNYTAPSLRAGARNSFVATESTNRGGSIGARCARTP